MPKTALLYCLLLLLLGGCSFIDLHHDLEKQNQLVTITGEIIANPKTTAAIKIVLIRGQNERPTITQTRIQKNPHRYVFIVEPDVYQVFAFEDLDGDGKYTIQERAGRTKRIRAITPSSTHRADIIIPKRPSKEILAKIAAIKKGGIIKRRNSSVELGIITSLDAPIFSTQNVAKGLWQPYGFIQEIPFGFFFLKEYDPQKKIVLFIHGVSGSPNQFKTIISNLDPNRFQAVVAYYPTGFPLPLVSQYMNNLIQELHITYNTKAISLVAHSMGGLVARGTMNILNQRNEPIIDCLISISTPWDGHAAAGSGLKYAPVVIPVWRDMTPGSDFLETLFSTPLPDTTTHYILFSFKGQSRTAGGNSDGAVSIKSQLRPVAQEGASLVRGFNEGHVSILSNTKVSILINQLLTNHIKKDPSILPAHHPQLTPHGQ